MKNILVGIDFGEASKRALDHARTLAGHFEGALHLLCIVQDPFSLPWAPAAPHEALASLVGGMKKDAAAHLEQLMTQEDRRRFRATLVTRVGKPADEILALPGNMRSA